MKPIELKKIRQRLRLTQRTLGEKLSLSDQQISNYESGRHPIPKVVELAVVHLAEAEFFDAAAFAPDWDKPAMEAYNAL